MVNIITSFCNSKRGTAAIIFMFIKLEVKKATRVDLIMQ